MYCIYKLLLILILSLIIGGRKKMRHAGKKVFSMRKSIQGQWVNNYFNKYPLVEVEKRKALPQMIGQMIQQPREDYDKTKYYKDKDLLKQWYSNKWVDIVHPIE